MKKIADHDTETAEKFLKLIDIVTRLRAPDGCPWDRKQTPQTFKGYLIEEAHELLEAVNSGDAGHIREELGDLLFQVIFLNNLYAEQGQFTMADVIETITAKMIRRHPHVFGDEVITSEKELRQKWHAIKAEENGGKKQVNHLLESVPKSMPALRRAQRVTERAARTGFDWPDVALAIEKAEEELAELKEAVAGGRKEKISEEFGDLLLALANIGRITDTDSEDALNDATRKFIARFDRFEQLLKKSDAVIADLDTDTLLDIWRKTKTPSW